MTKLLGMLISHAIFVKLWAVPEMHRDFVKIGWLTFRYGLGFWLALTRVIKGSVTVLSDDKLWVL